ncbi:hypothetical protein CW304_27895 [Bacillus sp. UFRGS-B20]|nr:hypothetical protein CW304_27895 [Bacillus sp. UFRGS-B20]
MSVIIPKTLNGFLLAIKFFVLHDLILKCSGMSSTQNINSMFVMFLHNYSSFFILFISISL